MLSTGGRRVVAIDADRDRGGLHYRLDVPVDRGSFTVDDLLPALGDLSDRALDNALSSCPCGAKLLPSAASAGAAADGSLSVAQQQDLVETLGSRFQHVVFDSAASRDGAALAGSSCVDLLVLVIVPELSSLGAAGRVLKYFDTARSGGCAVSLVVNRSLGRHDTITVSDIESYLTLPVAIVLPEETALCRGLPETGSFAFAQRSPLGRGLRAMARRLFDCATAPTS